MRHPRLLVALTSLLAVPVLAQESPDPSEVSLRRELETRASEPRAGNGGWVFAESSRLPRQLQAAVVTRYTVSSSASPSRPFATNLASPGSTFELGGELGLLDFLSVQAVGVQGTNYLSGGGATGAVAGLRASLLPRSWTHTQLVLASGWLHELTGRDGFYGRLQLGNEFGPVRTQVSAHGEHVFGNARDGVDLMLTAGVSVRLVSWLRLGVEYAGQDLEAAFEDDAEGGARHLVGPTLALSLLGDRLSIVGGPAAALGGQTKRIVGRAALSYAF